MQNKYWRSSFNFLLFSNSHWKNSCSVLPSNITDKYYSFKECEYIYCNQFHKEYEQNKKNCSLPSDSHHIPCMLQFDFWKNRIPSKEIEERKLWVIKFIHTQTHDAERLHISGFILPQVSKRTVFVGEFFTVNLGAKRIKIIKRKNNVR